MNDPYNGNGRKSPEDDLGRSIEKEVKEPIGTVAAALQDAFDFTLVGGEKPADAWTITLRARDEALGRILGTVTLKGSEYVESIRMSPSNDNVTDMILSNVRIVKGA